MVLIILLSENTLMLLNIFKLIVKTRLNINITILIPFNNMNLTSSGFYCIPFSKQ